MQTIPAGYKADNQGRLVPLALIRPVDLARDELVTELATEAVELSKRLSAFRDRAHADVGAFIDLSAERFGVKMGGTKGNVSLVSFDGRYKILRAISNNLVFDERLQAAKALVDECLTEWTAGTRDEVRALIQDAFRVDASGRVDVQRILSLRRIAIEDPRWKRAMTAISESLSVASTKSYIRVYERVGQTSEYRQIGLDLASA